MLPPQGMEEAGTPEVRFGSLHRREGGECKPFPEGEWRIETQVLDGVGESQGWLEQGRGSVPVVLLQSVMERVWEEADRASTVETGGLLLGYRTCWMVAGEERAGLVVCEAVLGEEMEQSSTRLVFRSETWRRWSLKRKEMPAWWRILGWYHSHPGWGIFLSEWDQYLCRHYFSAAEHMALVVDPIHRTQGIFGWTGVGEGPKLELAARGSCEVAYPCDERARSLGWLQHGTP